MWALRILCPLLPGEAGEEGGKEKIECSEKIMAWIDFSLL